MRMPIIIGEPSNFKFIWSVADACKAFEPQDLDDGLVVGFDAHGQRLELATDGFHISISPTGVEAADVLLKLLIEWRDDHPPAILYGKMRDPMAAWEHFKLIQTRIDDLIARP
jgi:hypothetical protein